MHTPVHNPDVEGQRARPDPDRDLAAHYLRAPRGAGEGLVDQEGGQPIDDREFRRLAENIPTLCWMANANGFIFWYNRRWYDYTGMTFEQMEGWGWQAVHQPDALPKVMERWTEAVVTGAPFEMVFPLRRADGVFRPFLTRVQPVRNEAGQVTRWFGVNTDLSAQAGAEAALQRSEARAEQVLDRMDEGFLLLDREFRVARMNSAGLRIDGRPREALIGRICWKLWPGTEDAEIGRMCKRVRASGTPEMIEVTDDWNGGRGWFEFRAFPVPEGLAIFYRDISARKRDEAALRNLNETLEARAAEAVAEQQAAQESLRQAQKMEAVGQLTGGIAHDFNNLLMGIAGSLELIEARLAAGRIGEADRFVAAAMASAARATSLTKRLLAFSRRQALDPKPVAVNTLVASMEELLRRTVGEQVKVKVTSGAGLWTVLCDAHQLENGLLNLVINARDAMPEGGELRIATENLWLDAAESGDDPAEAVTPGDYVALSVADTGTGMPAEVIARAFDPFFTTKPLGQGTGLGLSMVYGFARQCGGYLRIHSEMGAGTRVILYLPRHQGLPAEAPAAVAREEAGAAQGETVLVVEDDGLVRLLIVNVLAELGYGALEAADGDTGLLALESTARIDLLIADLGLPGLNGRELAAKARQLRPELKVLFVTGYPADTAPGDKRLETGTALINKPFALDAIAQKICAMLGRPEKH